MSPGDHRGHWFFSGLFSGTLYIPLFFWYRFGDTVNWWIWARVLMIYLIYFFIPSFGVLLCLRGSGMMLIIPAGRMADHRLSIVPLVKLISMSVE